MAPPGADDLDSTDLNDLPEDIWMLRPCEVYQDEYQECKSMKGRFHQYYVFGQYIDCDKWKTNYENCLKFRHTRSLEAVEKLLENEKARHEDRIRKAQMNDVWEYRSSPPADWAKPLPEWEKLHQNSVLSNIQENKTKTASIIDSPTQNSVCTII
ncbi:Hypothetical predicted protein [Octopus vulgaris]|uniref:UPF0545-like protein n=2 Tax=Octopus TaxID=6643 RepID=A0A9Y1GAF3_OCTVU|nr:UPF0545 protein C22orf39 homolog isoform X1 [Octopus sinensis]UUA79816.1 UPF0545-like protein [Octopus vulgaris]CAI9741338.1 Hypothetical predicted protein [Octopus vulgaris]